MCQILSMAAEQENGLREVHASDVDLAEPRRRPDFDHAAALRTGAQPELMEGQHNANESNNVFIGLHKCSCLAEQNVLIVTQQEIKLT